MKILSTFAIVVMCFFLSSCFELSAPNLIIPKPNEIDRITVYNDENETILVIIEDRSKIINILEFLKKHNHGWEYPLGDTMPIYPYQALFTKREEIKIIIRTYAPDEMGRGGFS
ncbi:MAG TPA: hypothetical protein V6D28_25350 [Leptolyngbyaceae cyanobacterium]